MAKTAMTALLALALAGCATVKAKLEPPPPPAHGTKLAQVGGDAFLPGKAGLTDAGRLQADPAVKVLKEYPDLKASIEGHTDSKGRAKSNQALSERRARAVADYVIAQGVPATRLTVRGLGEAHPVADNKSEDGRSRNRRVEILAQ